MGLFKYIKFAFLVLWERGGGEGKYDGTVSWSLYGGPLTQKDRNKLFAIGYDKCIFFFM